jgi:hypothetical protein
MAGGTHARNFVFRESHARTSFFAPEERLSFWKRISKYVTVAYERLRLIEQLA